jgi:hypothetical protein
VVLAAVLLQLRNLREWLPTSTHVDEPCFVAPAAHIASDGTLNPGWFGHPASTLIYPVAAIYRVVWGRGARAMLDSDGAPLYLVARGVSIAYAALGLVLVFFVARRLAKSDRAGVVATVIVALSPPIVELSATARSDGASLLFGTLALHALFRAVDNPTWRRLVAGGVALGAAVATKYYFAIFASLLVVAGLRALRARRNAGEPLAPALAHTVGGGAAAVATFALTTPYFFLDWSVAMRDLRLEAQAHAVGNAASWAETFHWYAVIGLGELVGRPLLYVLGVALGVALARWRKRPLVAVAAALAVVFVGATSFLHLTWTRWLVPVAPLVATVIASLVVDASDAVARRTNRRRLAIPVAALGTALLLVPPVRAIAETEVPRPPTLARRWIVDSAPAGSFVAMDGDAGEWLGPGAGARDHTLARGIRVRREVGSLADAGQTLSGLRCEGIDILVLNGLHAVNVLNGWESASEAARAFYRRVVDEGRVIATFGRLQSPERRVIAIGHIPCAAATP